MEIIKPDLKRAVKAIKEGKVLVCSTDTVYGLICDAGNKKAVEKIYKIKNRPKSKLLPIFVNNIGMAKKLAKIDSRQEKYLKKVWPGPVTAVFHHKKPGIRIPKYAWLLHLVEQLNRPLAESSANISGQPASTKIKDVLGQFEGKKYQPDIVIDAGDLPKAKPSKVIDLTIWPPKILRY
ncbi:MAG: threonylcarbamoyl-AMP synthase [Candidatus Nealsonbacteria bacterium]|nr:threonylcarbamoyl-AMP synthase [Candidatus Nealsonbacteria bacterium]